MSTTKTEENKSKNEKFKASCGTCKTETNHFAVQSIDVIGKEILWVFEGESETVDWEQAYQIIQCQGCDAFSFRKRIWYSDPDITWGLTGSNDGSTTQLFPQRGKNILNAKDFLNAPKNLRAIYREVVTCFNSGAPILCAAGLRATIEGLCDAQGVSDGPVEVKKKDNTVLVERKNNLEGKISGLCERGILTKNSADIFHEHRYLGNNAVHDLSRPSDADLRLAIEIVEHTLEALYEIPEKANALRANRAKRTDS